MFHHHLSRFVAWITITSLLLGAIGIPQTAYAAPAGTALQFNGTSQYVTFGASQGLAAPGLGVQTFTIETWFKRTGAGVPTSTSASGGGGLLSAIPLVTKGRGEGDGSDVDMNYWLGIDFATNVLVADFEECAPTTTGCPAGGTAGLNHAVFGTTPLQNNVWYHAAVTYDGQVWKLYLNGNLDKMLDIGAIRLPRWDSRQHAGIGTAMTSTGAAAGFFVGIIDETRVWNVVRTQSDIQASMNLELTGGTGLIGRWGLNEASGIVANNSIAGRPNGTLTCTGTGCTLPTWVSGFPIPDTTPPAAPTGLSATAGGTVVNLSWQANSESDLAGYNVYRSAVGGGPYTKLNSSPVTGTTYLDSGLTNGTTYYYVITAVDTSANESSYSTEVFATPQSQATGLQFDGTNDYVTFGAAPGLGVTTFTLEAWVKRDAGGTAMGTGTGGLGTGTFPFAYPVLTKGRGEGETPANLNTNYWLGIATTGVIAADFEDNAGGVNHPVIGVGTIPVGEWHHIAATYDGQTWRLYLDGILDATSTLTSPFTPESTSIQHAALGSALLSTGLPGTSPGYFAGVIDEARVWNVARGQSAIQSTKNSEITSGSGLVARWGMNEGSGTTTNSSVGSFPGTLTSGPIWVSGFEPPAANQVPNAPIVNAPTNGVTGIGTSPTLNVGVSDPDNNPLTVTFFGRPYASGVFAQIAQNTGVASGSSTIASWNNLGAGQEFEWYVTVSDGTDTTTGPTWVFHTTPSADPVFVGAGDIASCAITDDTATGELISGIQGTVFTTGDNVYTNGTAAEFTNCYATTPWGSPSVFSRTRPVPGNHDWGTGNTNNLNGYFGYYGANATDAGGNSYYSYDINANWHVVNLDTECQLVPGGCDVNSPQEIWLKADLAANTGKNVIAVWHKPRYSSGTTNYQALQPLWDDLYTAGVDILLDGHDHIYERLAPMKSGATLSDPPVADPLYGIRQFTVGTGGESHHGLTTPLPTSEVRNDTTYGIFKLTLHATTYDWQFLPIAGSTFSDSGSGTVHGPPPVCYPLTLGHTGNGSTPTVSPANSTGCPAGEYVSGEVIGLSGASPIAGWQIDSWYGTDNDASTANTNSLTMPGNAHTAGVNYSVVPGAGAALQFNGSNNYVTFGTGNTLASPTYTVETWFKRTGPGVGITTGGGGIASAIPLIAKGTSESESSNVDINYFLGIDANTGALIADFEEGAGGSAPSQNHPVSGTTVISNNVWYHAAVTYDGTTLRLYLNGVQENSLTVGQPAASATTAPTAFATSIRSDGTTIQGYFNGVLDEARIWNVARTQSEIRSTINSELTSGIGLIGRWGMNEGAGMTITDSTDPAANGTLTNSPAWVSPGAPFNLNLAPMVNAGADQNVPLQDNVELSGSVSDDGLPNPPGTVATTWSLVSGPGTVTFANPNAPSTTASFSANGTYVLRLTANDGEKTSSDDVSITISLVTNSALDLGGTSTGAYVTFGDPAKLDLAQFTVEAWFKRTGNGVIGSTGSGGITSAVPLVTHGAAESDNSNVDANWVLVIDDTSDVIAADFEDMAGGANHPVRGTTTITNNVWHHAAATYDGTTWRLYLDGNLEATLAANATPRSDSIQRAGLGAMITSTGTALGRFQGSLDEARVWNRALSTAEIQANINSELTTGNGLVARWGLNEGSGSSVSDSIATTAIGTINGTNYSWVTGAPFNIVINHQPATPILNSPANNATNVSTSPTLSAAVSDPDGGNLDVTFYGRPVNGNSAPGPDFTIIALPDTQYYTSSLNGGSPAIFNTQTDWIVNNIGDRNIVFVTQLGDCTEHGDQYEIEWQNADAAFDRIENPSTTGMNQGMPYGIAPGNHDQSPIGDPNGTTTYYNQYFGISRFLGRTYYGGHYGSNNDNHYELFSASGLDFIVVHLEYDPSANASVLAWADGLLQTYSNRRAIVVTHYMINGGNNASFSTQGQAIYNTLKDNSNLFLLLGGHVPSPAEGRRQDTYNGNVVNSLMSDYQGRTNGGNGWLRIMTFSPANNTIQVQTYSPWLGQFETDADSQFTLAYDMQGNSAPFTVIGTDTVPSGSNATVTWSGLAAGAQYEWYAVATDGSSTSTSSTNTFTTAGSVPTATAAPTDTPTAIPTDTPTDIPTDTPTSTPVDTQTPTDVPTATLTASATSTELPTSTNTPIPSQTATATQTSIPACDFDPGLVGCWQMEENGGSTLFDGSGLTNNASLTGSPLWSTGKVGSYAIGFDGSTQYATVPDNASLDITNQITLVAWVKPEQTTTQNLIKKAVNSNTNGYELSLAAAGSAANQKFFVRFNQTTNGDTYRVNSTTNYPADGSTWVHVAATYDGTTIKLYLNGVLNNSLPATISITANNLGLGIGADSNGGNKYQGAMDDVRVYNRALSLAEIRALIGLPTPTDTPTLTATQTLVPPTATQTPTETPVPPTSTPTDTPTATFTESPTSTNTPVNTQTATQTATATQTSIPACDFDPGLVGCWQMEENGGSTLLDGSGFANNGTLNGSPTWTPGKVGAYALTLNGSNQYATVPDNASLNIMNQITLAAWVKPAQTKTQTVLNKAIFKETGVSGVDGYELSLSGGGIPFVRFNQATSADNYRQNATSVQTNGTWMHIAATYDGSIIKIYVNGVLEGTKTATFTIASNNQPFAIGGQSNGLTTRFYSGTVDDARIYNRALTLAEIRALIGLPPLTDTPTATATPSQTPTDVPTATLAATQTPVPPTATQTPTETPVPPTNTPTDTPIPSTETPTATQTPTMTASPTALPTSIPVCDFGPGLAGCWQMEENGGSTLFDGSGLANNASLTGSPTWGSGKVGSYALGLDGSTQYASVPDNASFDLTNQITIAAWIKPGRVATQDLVKKAINGGTNGYELSLAATTSTWPQKVFFRINQVSSNDTYRVNSTTVYPIDGNTWMHVAATFDGTNLRIYINGQLEGTMSAAGQTIATNNLALGIGAQSDGQRKYQGAMDDVRVYNRALSLTEIRALIGLPTPTDTPTPTETPIPPTATTAPTDTPTAISTSTDLPTATQTPTDVPANTPTATTVPTNTPPASGLACTTLQPKPMTTSTGEKPQSKVWTYGGAWWAVFPTNASGASSAGTWLWKLQGTTWTEVLKLSNSTSAKADVKPDGNLAHVLLYAGTTTELVSVEYNSGTYQPWTARPTASPLSLSGSEIATIEIDSMGRMWLATENDATDQIIIYYSDSPYSSWSAPVTLATGVNDDDISAIVKLPNQIGVLWSNQNTQRYGFRVHNDGDATNSWAADEVPASQSALSVGLGMADDHLNVKVASDGTIYAAVKTSYDTAGYTKVALLVRRPAGSWDNLYSVDEAGTRGIVMLNEVNSSLTVIYTSSENYNPIVYKQSSLQSINFGSRTTLRSGSFNDVSSMKSNYTDEFVVLYASSTEVAGQLCSSAPGGLPTPTDTPAPPTATWTPTDTSVPPSPTEAPTSTPTVTAVPTVTPIPPTNTLIPPTATETPTSTPVPPTATWTPTNTPVQPTTTNTLTDTPVPPTATWTPTDTPIPPTATWTPTNTPPIITPTFTPTFTPTPSGETCKQEGACLVFEYLGYATDSLSGQTTITFRVTNKCKQSVSYVAIGTDGFTSVAPPNGSVYTGSLGTYNVLWTGTTGSPGFASIEFQPKFRSFKNGASEVFSIVVTNFDPNRTIQVAGHIGTSPDETFDFLLSQTICPVGPTATPTNTPTPGATNTPTPTATVKPTKTPRPH